MKINKAIFLCKRNGDITNLNHKYLGCNISSSMNSSQEVKQRIAMAKETFNREKVFLRTLGKRTKEEASEVLCVECSVVWRRTLDTTTE